MEIGQVVLTPEFNIITAETVWHEHVITQEDIDKEIQQLKEQQRQEILMELSQLDAQISRVEEDIIASINLPLHPNKQAILNRKAVLRQQLNNL